MDQDVQIRDAAVRHCRLLSLQWGEAVPAAELIRGFMFEGERVHLWGPSKGIFKPKQLSDGALTVTSTLASAYEDEEVDGDIMLYNYAPSSQEYGNNDLKRAAELGRPVILFKQVQDKTPAEYMILAPVAILGFDDTARKFRLSLAKAAEDVAGLPSPAPAVFSKAYAETITRARLHQAHFRRRTLDAYRDRCCICNLRERRLLDAAHIVPDRLPEGVPEVRNGMSMCPTHHRAYDRGILLVHESYEIDVRLDRVERPKEAVTQRALLDYRGKPIKLPKARDAWPDPKLLLQKLGLVG